MFRLAPLVTTITIIAALGGCYDVVSTARVQHPVRVTTHPPHAELLRIHLGGKQESLGSAPQELQLEVIKEERRFAPFQSWLLTTALGAITGGCTVAATQVKSAEAQGSLTTCAILAAVSTALGIVGSISGHARPTKSRIRKGEMKIVARARGYQQAMRTIEAAGGKLAHLALHPMMEGIDSPPRRALADKGPIVAVFDVQIRGGSTSDVSSGQVSTLLHSRLAELRHFRLVPRSSLRKRLKEQKRESYKLCYDESCQIEIGKALAAQKSLATRMTISDKRCLLSAVLYDLKSETSEAAAVVETPCSSQALYEAIGNLVRKLVKGEASEAL